MGNRIRRQLGGFTLVELMIVVVIMGLLAAIAIPAFTRYIRRARTAEATNNIQHIALGEVTAYQQSADQTNAHFVRAPVTGSATPADAPSSTKYPANPAIWTSDQGWNDLDFAIDGPHFYQYAAIAGAPSIPVASLLVTIMPTDEGGGGGSATDFNAAVYGDIDGDGTLSTFSRVGAVVGGEIQMSGLNIIDELE